MTKLLGDKIFHWCFIFSVIYFCCLAKLGPGNLHLSLFWPSHTPESLKKKKKKLSHSFHLPVNIFQLYLVLSSAVITVLMFQIRFPGCISHHTGGSGSSKSCCSVTKLLGLTPAPLRITVSKIQLRFRMLCWLTQLDYHWEFTVPSPT